MIGMYLVVLGIGLILGWWAGLFDMYYVEVIKKMIIVDGE